MVREGLADTFFVSWAQNHRTSMLIAQTSFADSMGTTIEFHMKNTVRQSSTFVCSELGP